MTTRDRRISGRYRGIEIVHGDRSILIETANHTYSVPVESVVDVSGLRRALSPISPPGR